MVIILCRMTRFTLITDKSPTTYTKEDYESYKEQLRETNVMYRGYDPESNYPRANRSTKWNKVLRSIWEEFQQTRIVHSASTMEKDCCLDQ